MRAALIDIDGRPTVAAISDRGATPLDAAWTFADVVRGTPGLLADAAASAGEGAIPLAETTFLPPCVASPKIFCIGQNYRDHCEEQGQPVPDRAILFSKYATCLNSHGCAVVLPPASESIDYEAELAVVIGGRGGGGRFIPEADALDHVAGYLCANDVTARDIQKQEGQWIRGKSPDTFLPVGPWLTTADEIADPHGLDIALRLNGAVMQKSNTCNLVFRIPYLIAHLSTTMTLAPGDIILTGTPGGVGFARKPPVFLRDGDTMEVEIAGLGVLRNSCQRSTETAYRAPSERP